MSEFAPQELHKQGVLCCKEEWAMSRGRNCLIPNSPVYYYFLYRQCHFQPLSTHNPSKVLIKRQDSFQRLFFLGNTKHDTAVTLSCMVWQCSVVRKDIPLLVQPRKLLKSVKTIQDLTSQSWQPPSTRAESAILAPTRLNRPFWITSLTSTGLFQLQVPCTVSQNSRTQPRAPVNNDNNSNN